MFQFWIEIYQNTRPPPPFPPLLPIIALNSKIETDLELCDCIEFQFGLGLD